MPRRRCENGKPKSKRCWATAAKWKSCATGARSWPAQRCGWRPCCIAWSTARRGASRGRPSRRPSKSPAILIPHAEAVLNMMQAKEDSADDDARYVLRWIERHGRREFTKSEAQHHGKRRFPKADDIDPALAELTRRGYIRLRPTEATGPGRPPSPTYEVNPATFANMRTPKSAPTIPTIRPANRTGSNSGNIGSAFGAIRNHKPRAGDDMTARLHHSPNCWRTATPTASGCCRPMTAD